jgi:hypothetical protein
VSLLQLVANRSNPGNESGPATQQAAALTIESHPKMAGLFRECGFFGRLNPHGIAIHIQDEDLNRKF